MVMETYFIQWKQFSCETAQFLNNLSEEAYVRRSRSYSSEVTTQLQQDNFGVKAPAEEMQSWIETQTCSIKAKVKVAHVEKSALSCSLIGSFLCKWEPQIFTDWSKLHCFDLLLWLVNMQMRILLCNPNCEGESLGPICHISVLGALL